MISLSDLLYKGIIGLEFKHLNPDRTVSSLKENLVDSLKRDSSIPSCTLQQIDCLDTHFRKLTENLINLLDKLKKYPIDGSILLGNECKLVESLKKTAPTLTATSLGQKLIPVVKKLFPSELMGGQANKLIFLKRVSAILKLGMKDVVQPDIITKGLNIKKFKWLKQLKIKVCFKQIVITKLFMLLFDIVKKLIVSMFYVTECQESHYKLKFIPLKAWQSQVDKKLTNLAKEETLIPLETKSTIFCDSVELGLGTIPVAPLCTKLNARSATVRWLPKGKKLRPIIYVKGDKYNNNTKAQKLFVTSLCKKTPLNKKLLGDEWERLAMSCWKNKFNHPYIVAVDLHNAYGSIIHEKMLNIINEATVNSQKYQSSGISTLVAGIKNRVCKQIVRIKKKNYFLKKGLSQAMPLSASLCNLYIEHLVKTHLGNFDAQGHLLRAMDDFLFITPDKSLAQQFLERMTAGFEDYGMFINDDKTQHNLIDETREIKFYGYTFNNRLEVLANYVKEPVPFRYRMCFSQYFISDPLGTLNNRLLAILSFKLFKLTMNPIYMSMCAVARNLFYTGCFVACCFKAALNTEVVQIADSNQAVQIITGISKKMFSKVCQSFKPRPAQCLYKSWPKFLQKEEVYWIVSRAFLLVLEHGSQSKLPGNLLHCITILEESKRSLVRSRVKGKLLSFHIVDKLPPQFCTGS